MRKLRLAVVGLGRVSKSHLPAIRKLSEAGKVELAALVSRDESKARTEAVNWPGAAVYSSYDDALRDPSIDAFLLLLPHHLHAGYSIAALRASKHVLVEKPMALHYAEAQQMAAAAAAAGSVLMIGQSRRFYAPVQESIRFIREGRIGDLININALLLAHMHQPAADWWRDNRHIGGFIIPLWGSHILDYVLWAYGELPETVYAQGYSHNANWEGEDEVAISLKFSGDRMANVLMSFNAGSQPTDDESQSGKRIWSTNNSIYERYVIGSKGMLRLHDEDELFWNGEKMDCQQAKGVTNFERQLEEFVHAVLQSRRPIASGEEILGVMRVIDSCYESMKDNRVVHLSEI